MHFVPPAIPGSQPQAVGDSFPQLRAQTPAHAGSPIHDQPAHCLVAAGGSEVLDPNPCSLSSARLWVESRKIKYPKCPHQTLCAGTSKNVPFLIQPVLNIL